MTKSLAIFGAGSALKDLLSILPSEVKIVGIGDNNSKLHGLNIKGFTVLPPQEFAKLECEIFVIAGRAVDSIRMQLSDLGVDRDRICAYCPSFSEELNHSVNKDIKLLNQVLGLKIPLAGISTMYLLPKESEFHQTSSSADLIRDYSFQLAASQINHRKIEGAVAELGVFRGDQAALLSRLFPDRDLYLFDTFEGFSEKDLSSESQLGFSESVIGEFKDTSVDLVMSKMFNPTRVHIHQGYFPETTNGISDKFAFVSLDVDLYEPILAGLEWFYKRLSKGGMIFVHDYNSQRYLGVRAAVEKFISETSAITFPIADFSGSICIAK